MKQETKMLFGYLRSAVKVATSSVNSGLEHFQVSEEKVIKQIDELESKLEEMEVALKTGGVIQDKNGNLCKHGDKVIYRDPSFEVCYNGKLMFDNKVNRLFVVTEDKRYFTPVKMSIEKCTSSSVAKEEILNDSKDIKNNGLGM